MESDLAELRNLLGVLAIEMAATGAVTSTEIADRFLLRHGNVVMSNADSLIRTAIIKFVSDVSRRKPPAAVTHAQGDLFEGYSGPGLLVTTQEGSSAKPRKTILDMTKLETRIWLKVHARKKRIVNKDYEEVQRIFDLVKLVGTDQTKIRDALQMAKKTDKRA